MVSFTLTMLRLLLVFWVIRTCIAEDYPKCCDSESVLLKTNNTYSCTRNNTHRLEIVANSTNYIEQSPDGGYCVDVIDKGFSLFKVNDTEVTKEQNLKVSFYPKCCPLNYFYNSTIHGCVRSQKKLDIFFQDKYVRVGLPHCKIIVDYNLGVNTLLEMETYNGNFNKSWKDNKIYREGLWCADKNEKNLLVARVCYSDFGVCKSTKCVHKCCPDGQSFINGSFCRDTYIHGVDLLKFSDYVDNPNDTFAIIHGHNSRIYPLYPGKSLFHLDSNGTFMQYEIEEYLEKLNVSKYYTAEQSSYCIEHALKKTLNSHYFFRAFPDPRIPLRFITTRIAMAFSCVFLLLTVIYYCLSDEKRTVFGKTLISYSLACLMTFLLLSYLTLISKRPVKQYCVAFAFGVLYSTLASFTWMNVMCVDIYWTFGSSKSFSSRQHSKELKRFMLYSLYGWGFPLILTLIPLIFYHVDVLPYFLQVHIDQKEDNKKCLIYKGKGNYAQLLFTTTPLAVMELCNLIFFIKTAISCLKVKREINKMNDSHVMKGEKKKKFNNFRNRFGLLVKLFLIMGISFMFEVVSASYNFRTNLTATVIELIWDTFNSLQGFFIFVIFIAKKRVLKKFQKNVGLSRLRKFSFVSSALTQTTSIPTLNSNKT